MGKRTSNLTGLSRYVLDALKESSADTKPTSEDQSIAHEIAVVATRLPSRRKKSDERSAKRRKTEVTKSVRSKYDAAGLVPYYRTADQVPSHLQKCPSLLNDTCFNLIDISRVHAHRFFSKKTVFLFV